ncbi:MAG: mannose-1-phosphate guanylyltransferase/mannose-6-phosphate isomerase [Burkholderiales bacterium]|nr:mannose-1-phosphate guanylyltransferase/mannose-6-phosphate isomerase [Burkholderiales bacterium]
MAGGSGTRLWPLSRAQHPKQFLVLQGKRSLFQQAALRLASLGAADIEVAAPCIVGNEDHRFLVLDQLRELRLPPATVLLEPMGRNTAPAMTLAALHARGGGLDPVLVVSPADQTVTDEAAFTAALQRAVRVAAGGAIVILGVTPDRPETGFGYIRASAGDDPGAALRVAEFVEKPDLETAQRYLAQGHYYWNSGMFVVRASVWLAALERFRPDIAAASNKAWAAKTLDASFIRPGRDEFAAIPAESVDYSVMEQCPADTAAPDAGRFDIRMVPLAAGWSDLGAWDAVWQVSAKDTDGNASVGDALLADSRNTLVHATSRLVGVVGLDDVVVVETADAVLVVDRSRSQDVKAIVGQLHSAGRSEHTLHRQVHRPWGWYDSIDSGARFQVKRIMVKPGASLSLQMHHHRAEHWIVVSGTAEVTNGDQVILLTENQSTYIPLGTTHRLANPGKVPLEIIEVQSGSYLGEDDIVRFEDTYGRTT